MTVLLLVGGLVALLVGAEVLRGSSLIRLVIELVIGVAAILIGAQLLVDGAVEVAHALGVSETVIGLTIVAIGTTPPELVTTLVSTFRGERDLAIGNLLGRACTTSPSSWASPSSSLPPAYRSRRRSSPRISCCWSRPR